VDGREALSAAQQGDGSYGDAVVILQAEVAEYPADAHRHEWLAMACVGAERYADALVAANAAVALDPSCADAHWARSISLAKAGRVEDAKDAAERAVALAPQDVPNWIRLVYACHEAHDEAATFAAAAELEKRAPEEITPFLVRAMLYDARKAWGAGSRELEHAQALEPVNGTWSALLAASLLRQRKYRDARRAAEHALELAPRGEGAPLAAYVVLRVRTALSYGIPLWNRLHARTRVLAGVTAFAAVTSLWSLRVALLLSAVPAATKAAYSLSQFARTPLATRRLVVPSIHEVRAIGLSQTWAPGVAFDGRHHVAVTGGAVAFAFALSVAVGATFGHAMLGAIGFVTLALLIVGAAWTAVVTREARWHRHIRAAELAHECLDFEAQWEAAHALAHLEHRYDAGHRAFVHALAHHDVDAAMVPLDALLNAPPATEWARDSLHCAAGAVSWALMVRGQLGGARAWAQRAVELRPDRPRAHYAVALAESGEFEVARTELDAGGDTTDLSPVALAGMLRARAVAEAVLGWDEDALATLEEARALDGTSEEIVYAIRRVGEILDARNDEAV
jgi:tetratricopeptide (TPR) repeat protein